MVFLISKDNLNDMNISNKIDNINSLIKKDSNEEIFEEFLGKYSTLIKENEIDPSSIKANFKNALMVNEVTHEADKDDVLNTCRNFMDKIVKTFGFDDFQYNYAKVHRNGNEIRTFDNIQELNSYMGHQYKAIISLSLKNKNDDPFSIFIEARYEYGSFKIEYAILDSYDLPFFKYELENPIAIDEDINPHVEDIINTVRNKIDEPEVANRKNQIKEQGIKHRQELYKETKAKNKETIDVLNDDDEHTRNTKLRAKRDFSKEAKERDYLLEREKEFQKAFKDDIANRIASLMHDSETKKQLDNNG